MFSGGITLVALSGGGDSVALLRILITFAHDLDITIEAAHLNHALRGEESDRDERFCRLLCDNLGIHLTVKRLKPGTLSNSKDSLETIARKSRMSFLEKTAVARNVSRIATGHTEDDLAETIIQRLLRGTGPTGLAGILPVRNGLWVRPLLSTTRASLREYLSENAFEYCEDSTNNDTDLFRNRIRSELLPIIKKRYSMKITAILGRLADISRIQENYLSSVTEEAAEKCFIYADEFKILLDKSKFMNYHTMVKQRLIRHCLILLEGADRDADMEEVFHILEHFDKNTALADVTSEIRFEIIKQYASFSVNVSSYKPQPLIIPGETNIPAGGGMIRASLTYGEHVPDGKLFVAGRREDIEQYGPLTVGTVLPGETIKVACNGGSSENKGKAGGEKEMKIRDVFSSFSVPQTFRNYMPIVRSGAVPVWIPGMIVSARLLGGIESNSDTETIFLTFKDGIRWM